MKLKDLTDKLAFLSKLGQPILLLDNGNKEYCLKYRKAKELPIGFYEKFNHEIARYMDDILNLEVVFVCDKGSMLELYIDGLKSLFLKIDKGG